MESSIMVEHGQGMGLLWCLVSAQGRGGAPPVPMMGMGNKNIPELAASM
jgi:hypothetical protein